MEYKTLIDIFNISKDFRREINESLIAMGLPPLPQEINIYPDVKNHLEEIKKRFETELLDLSQQKSSLEPEKNEKIKRALDCINDKIEMIIRDIKVIQYYHKTYEQNKDINAKDVSDLNEYLFDTVNLNEFISKDEKRLFSKFIALLFQIKKNASGVYPKIRDYSELKEAVKEWWNELKKSPNIDELVKRSVFRTADEIDAVLA